MTSVFNFRNVLILLGIIITSVGIVYFATEFFDRLSEWTRVASLALLTVVCVALGVHFESAGRAEVVDRPGLRWLRVPTALFLLALLSAFAGVLVFLGIEELDDVVKVGVVILLGIGLILLAAWRFRES